jgi:hypothetical protein
MRGAAEAGRRGDYDTTIRLLSDVRISAGLLMQKDPEMARMMALDVIDLVSQGYQLKAYAFKLENDPGNSEARQSMERIARGELSYSNPHVRRVMQTLEEWEAKGYKNIIRERVSEHRNVFDDLA